jgi:hypothetical protein
LRRYPELPPKLIALRFFLHGCLIREVCLMCESIESVTVQQFLLVGGEGFDVSAVLLP